MLPGRGGGSLKGDEISDLLMVTGGGRSLTGEQIDGTRAVWMRGSLLKGRRLMANVECGGCALHPIAHHLRPALQALPFTPYPPTLAWLRRAR